MNEGGKEKNKPNQQHILKLERYHKEEKIILKPFLSIKKKLKHVIRLKCFCRLSSVI